MKRLALVAVLLACGGPDTSAPPPFQGEIAPGASTSFDALVASKSAGQTVTWSVDAGGGSITQAGVYTAPDCAKLIAALPAGTVLSASGVITGTEHVLATWSGGSLSVTVTIAEQTLGVDVAPTPVSVGPSGTVQFRATVHYTCHDQTT